MHPILLIAAPPPRRRPAPRAGLPARRSVLRPAVSAAAAGGLALLTLCSGFGSGLAQEPQRYTLVMGGQTHTLPAIKVEGVDFVPLPALAEILRAPLQRDPVSGDPALTIGRSRLGVSLRQPIASLDNKVIPLDAAARQRDGEVWVSADFISEAVAQALGEPARLDRARRRIELGGDKSLRVTMRTATGDAGTRITFELSRPVPHALRLAGRKLYLTLDSPSLEVPFELQELDTPVVKRVKLLSSEREKGFVLDLGKDFAAYDLTEGASPPSLVIDLRRAGYEGRSLAQAAPPAGAPPPLPASAAPAAPAVPRSSRGADNRPVIVLDPGHGGEEKGASGPGGLLEKDVTLDVAQRLRTRLERGGTRILLTREDDRALPLAERTALANHQRAELFVSIHANAARKQDAKGAETYFLSYQATDAEAQAVAAMENESAGGGGPAPGRADLKLVLWDMAQAEHLRASSSLAEAVQGELNALLGLRDRGVKQAPFRVLMSASMPAILIEIGFITNPDEEEKLRSPAYRESLALAIAQSIQRFRDELQAGAAPSGRARGGMAP